MRIAIGGIEHETNTYCQGLTPADAFALQRGEQMLKASGQHSHVGGAIDACLSRDIEPVPLMHAWAQPSGTIERAAYEGFKDELLTRLEGASPVDGIVLLLHGAGVVDGVEDLEGDLVAAVRAQVGPELPIAASFDLHGNITQTMADGLNGVFACHQYPHVDMHERAEEAVAHVADMAASGRRARCHVVNVPMLIPTTTTFEGPAERMLQSVLAQELEQGPDVVDVSWFHGFPYTDIAHVGSTFVVTSFSQDGFQVAQMAAGKLWQDRQAFIPERLSGDEAVAQAQRLKDEGLDGPVVINETSDNCGGGTPGDGTHLLRSMLTAGLGERACFGFIVDPVTVAQAAKAGVGHTIDIALGGRTDGLHGEPIETQAYVKTIADGRLVLIHMFKGMPLNIGPMVRLVIDGMDVIVGSRRSQTFDAEPFLAVGVDVQRYDFVALKSSNHFRAGFREIAGAIVTADTPGLCTLDISVFPRQRTARRFWPLHEDARFDPSPA